MFHGVAVSVIPLQSHYAAMEIFSRLYCSVRLLTIRLYCVGYDDTVVCIVVTAVCAQLLLIMLLHSVSLAEQSSTSKMKNEAK